MTKILHLQTHLPSSGNAAFRLHQAFRQAGVDSSILTLTSDITLEHTQHLGRKAKIKAMLDSRLQSYLTRNAVSEYGYFSYPILGTDISNFEEVKQADIIYLHWAIGGFLSIKNIEQLARTNKPIIVFMHDMWSITGGCHYSLSCDKFKIMCRDCQIFPAGNLKDLALAEFNSKRKIYNKYKNLYFVSPSRWLHNLAKDAALTAGKPVFHIPNILNRNVFKAVDKSVAKQLLDISTEERVITFGATSVDSPYKGWSYLQEALTILHQQKDLENIIVMVFGSGHNQAMADAVPFKIKFLGRLRDDYSTALAYNASDVFVVPSLADNLPTTVMESLACGTPAVGFETGGIPDMIQHKQNGYLAAYRSAPDLAEGIQYCLKHSVQGSLLPAFETEALLQKHFSLFDQVLHATPVSL